MSSDNNDNKGGTNSGQQKQVRLPPASDQMRVSSSGRRKVPLPPGRSQLDWIRTQNTFIPPRPRTISMHELRQHRERGNAWTAINGHVFNMGPYVEFHPGGIDMIMSGAGKDATKLFDKYHSWVNPNFMLRNLFIGMLEDDAEDEDEDEDEDDDDDDDVDDDDDGDDAESATTATTS